jgi:hypothetical protein
MSPWDLTPKSSGPHRRQKPVVGSGLLAIAALVVVFAVLCLTIWLVPPFWK